ncbi:SUN domain-containing protein 1-like isoform X2 [Cyclopterus lumpus]|nr:SUN domain-containing protein 1-like isoform X2 [Cyclopterus lumpus]
MSRRSLRLEEGLLDRVLPHSSASFSVGGASWRSNKRSLKPRRSQNLLSSSCSESLLNTPVGGGGGGGLLSSSVTSDASLLSSLLEESSVQESMLVDTFWESTTVEDQSSLDPEVLKHRSVSTYRSFSKCTSSPEPGGSTLYCRDRSLRTKTGVLQLWFLLWVRTAAARCVCALTHTWQVCRELLSRTKNRHGARSGLCGVMDLKRSTVTWKAPPPDGSLCDGCQEKQHSWSWSRSRSWSWSWSSRASCLWGLMWSAAGLTGDVFRRLIKRWRHMTCSFLLTGFPLRLLLVLLPLLLLFFSLCWFGPAGVASEMGTVVSGFWSVESRPAEATEEESKEVLPPDGRPPAAVEEEESALRLGRLEESQAALWHHVEASGRRHTEVLRLYTDLQQLVSDQNHREQSGPWIRDLLNQHLDRWQTEKQQSQASRLDQLELQLQTLAARTQEVPWRPEAAPPVSPSSTLPAAVGDGVNRPSHDALLAEISRLEVALEDVRRGVQGLSGGLDRIQQTVSAQVREEVRVLVYGNQLAVGGGAPGDGGDAPESLLQWLSLRYVSGADLQAALSSLELSILQDLRLHRGGAAVREEVLQAGVTQEDVREIVRNALRLFSQDRTGLADFALESGGGSVLNTRCSETHQTKVALYSLFGVPLWYFSQSPRAVIQPDVHPGSCWAFKGSAGVLVLRLSRRILPTSFSLEHLPKALAPSGGRLSSAPRDFSVYGLEDEGQQGGKLLGSFTYDEAGEALQTFRVLGNDAAFQIIEVQVLSNWGHQDYTCLYRFRAHGTPEEELGEEPVGQGEEPGELEEQPEVSY